MHLRTNKFTSFRIKVRHGQEQKMVLSCISVLKFVKDSSLQVMDLQQILEFYEIEKRSKFELFIA